ncbi:MAG TPA: TrbI/VirB10 family protein [Acidobacteriaceae bacterium]
MSINDNNRNGSRGLPAQLDDSSESRVVEAPPSQPTTDSVSPEAQNGTARDPAGFATRADVKGTDGIGKSKLVLLGGGLAVAVLFFVFTALVGKSPKRQLAGKQPTQQARQEEAKPPKGSVTPVMESVRTPAPDNAGGQLGPADIRRTRSADGSAVTNANSELAQKPAAAKSATVGSLGSVPSFADTQQKWEEPQPYGEAPTASTSQMQQQQNALKEPSLVFVRAQVQSQATSASKVNSGDGAPLLEMAPGTRIQAKLETQISSAVQAPVVAVVEYTYAIGDKIIVPAGARVYGQLQQADRSGLVSVKFDEIELLDGAREKIEAIGTGLDLGPIKGNVYGKNTGKNFLVRVGSGLGSVLAEIAGNNSSAAFSEDDMLRERVAENIGTAGDSEVMNLNANSRIVVSVPADTKIYIVFTKHPESSSELHKVASATP